MGWLRSSGYVCLLDRVKPEAHRYRRREPFMTIAHGPIRPSDIAQTTLLERETS